MQKTAVAHLLFGLCLFLADDKPDTAIYDSQVKRMLVVCGLKAGLDAISDRAVVLRKLDDYLAATVAEERYYFLADHAALVEEIRQRAALIQTELDLKAENERKLGIQEELVKKRLLDVKQHKEELEESRAETAKKVKELRELSQDLLSKRVEARDVIRDTQAAEKKIRELEKQIIELEKNR